MNIIRCKVTPYILYKQFFKLKMLTIVSEILFISISPIVLRGDVVVVAGFWEKRLCMSFFFANIAN